MAAACERLAAAVSSGAEALPATIPSAAAKTTIAPSALTPVLAELERVVRELPLAERPEVDQPARAGSLFVPDAFTNPRYAQFALKVTLAAMFCYVAYTAVDWNGIHTCMITCAIVALGSAGATIHKATLRLVGCAIGGGLALASIVFLVPHMTSIAAARAAGRRRHRARRVDRDGPASAPPTLGVQLAFAFYLAVLQGYGPSTDVTEFRDRFVGVVFGVVVMALVFAYVWPERAGSGHGAVARGGAAPHGELADGARRPARAARRRLAGARRGGPARRALCVRARSAHVAVSGERGRRVRDADRPRAARPARAGSRSSGIARPGRRLAARRRCGARASLGYGDRRSARRRREVDRDGRCVTRTLDLRTPLAALGAASRASGSRGGTLARRRASRCARRSSTGSKRSSGQRGPHERSRHPIPAASSSVGRCCSPPAPRRSGCAPIASAMIAARARAALGRPEYRDAIPRGAGNRGRAARAGAQRAPARPRSIPGKALRARRADRHRPADQPRDARRLGARARSGARRRDRGERLRPDALRPGRRGRSSACSSPLPKTVLTPEGFFVADTQFFLPALTLKWLLFDFGGKEATVDATTQALAAANFGFNATHQKIVFDVTRAYYALNAVQGRVEVARASLNQAQTLQDAAESRRGRGLATLPEVLQAREQTARAAYELQEAIAGETDARMALLEAMGVRPTTPLRIAGLGGRRAARNARGHRRKARRSRARAAPGPARARRRGPRARSRDPQGAVGVLSADRRRRRRRSEHRPRAHQRHPRLGGRERNRLRRRDMRSSCRSSTAACAEPARAWPKSQRRVADEELELARDRTARQVVKAYEDLKVALRQREAAVALLAAAERSYDAAIDSYRNGVATFVDVTNAQTALTKARTADTETRSAVFTAAAALAFSTGDIAPPGVQESSFLGEPPRGR